MVNFNFIHSALGEIEGKKPNLGCGQWNWEGSFNSCVFRKKYWNVSYHIFMIFSNEFCKFFFIQGIHCTVHPGNIHCKWDYYSGGCGFWNGKFYNTDTTAHSAYNNFLGCKTTIDRIIAQKRARCKWKLFFNFILGSPKIKNLKIKRLLSQKFWLNVLV